MASEPLASPSISADNPLMPRLYQLAVGPVQTAYYQKHFEQLDALGRPSPIWNTAAGLCTLAWMGLRGLWLPAAVYALVIAALATLWWLLDLHHRLPWPAAAALATLLVAAAIAIPGFWGTALYHRTVRTRTMQALTQSRTLSEAMALLQSKAPKPAHVQWASGAQAAAMLLLAVLLGAAVNSASKPAASPAAANVRTHEDTARALAALTGTPAATPAVDSAAPSPTAASLPKPTASSPQAAGPTVESVTAALAAATASLPAQPAPTPAAPQTAQAESAPVSAAAPSAHPTETARALPPTAAPAPKVPAASAPNPSAQPSAPPAAPQPEASKVTESPKPKSTPAPTPSPSKSPATKTEAKPEKKPEVKSEAKPDSKRAPSTKQALEADKFYINAGLYSREENAQRAVQRLRTAGLPVFSQMIDSSKGPMTRVRVGPFATRSQAESAVQKVTALKLEAQLFHNAP